jgi:hypothetical protein
MLLASMKEPRAAPRELLVLIRYQSANERSFHRALDTLTAMQKDRLRQAKQTTSPKSGFVSQPISEPISEATPETPEIPTNTENPEETT